MKSNKPKHLIVQQVDKKLLGAYLKMCANNLTWNGISLNRILDGRDPTPEEGAGATANKLHLKQAYHRRDEALNVILQYVDKALLHDSNKGRTELLV